MTYEEAIDYMKFEQTQVCLRECSSHRGDWSECDFCKRIEMMDKAIEALDKADKYRWHDLRKNPNDLPKDDSDLLAVRYAMGLIRQTAVNFTCNTWFDCIFNETANDVIAWREIEPFDE